jgi:hypothetical protein
MSSPTDCALMRMKKKRAQHEDNNNPDAIKMCEEGMSPKITRKKN